jgi:hypothetical protein
MKGLLNVPSLLLIITVLTQTYLLYTLFMFGTLVAVAAGKEDLAQE